MNTFGITHPLSPKPARPVDCPVGEDSQEEIELDDSESECSSTESEAVSSSRKLEIIMHCDINVFLEEMRCKAHYRHCEIPNGDPLEEVRKWVAKAQYITYYGDFSDVESDVDESDVESDVDESDVESDVDESDVDDVVPLQQSMDIVYPDKDCSSQVRYPILEKKGMDPKGTGRPLKKSKATDIVKEDKEKSSSPTDRNGSPFDIEKEETPKEDSSYPANYCIKSAFDMPSPLQYPLQELIKQRYWEK